FTLQRFTLFVQSFGSGSRTVTSNPPGIDCASSCSAEFDFGQVVTLTANPGPGTVFDSWSDACSGTQPTCTITITGDTLVSAVLHIMEFTVSIARLGTGTGNVTSFPAGIN